MGQFSVHTHYTSLLLRLSLMRHWTHFVVTGPISWNLQMFLACDYFWYDNIFFSHNFRPGQMQYRIHLKLRLSIFCLGNIQIMLLFKSFWMLWTTFSSCKMIHCFKKKSIACALQFEFQNEYHLPVLMVHAHVKIGNNQLLLCSCYTGKIKSHLWLSLSFYRNVTLYSIYNL